MKLSLINDLEDQMPVAELAGHVTAVFPRKEGEGEYGPWSFQDATLSDGETEVRLKFKNMEDMKPIQGKDVAIRANKSKAHGLTGVLKVVEEYKGKTFHKVQLTNSCKIVVGLNGGEDGYVKGSERPLTRTDTDKDDFIPMTHGSKGEALPAVDHAKAYAMQSANAMLICLEAARYTVLEWEKRYEAKVSDDQFQAITSTFFIRLDKNGLVSALPAKPLPSDGKAKKTPTRGAQEEEPPF